MFNETKGRRNFEIDKKKVNGLSFRANYCRRYRKKL